MNDLTIQKYNFDIAKERIKEFSEKTSSEITLKKVDTSAWLIFDHNVTGEEFNSRIQVIQRHLRELNETNNKTIKEFREIYKTFDYLDKEYVAGILANIKALEKTNDDIRKQQRILKARQQDINNICQEIKDRVYPALESAFDDIAANEEKIEVLHQQLLEYDSKFENQRIMLENKRREIDKTLAEVNRASEVVYESMNFVNEQSQENSRIVAGFQQSLVDAHEKAKYLMQEHANLAVAVQRNKEAVHADVAKATQETNNAIETLNQKIKYAYLVSGGSAAVAIVEI